MAEYTPTIGYAPEMVAGLQGRKVRIPAGVPFRSTHPQVDGWQLTKRAQTITVNHVLQGSEDPPWRHDDRKGRPVSDPSVRWAGTGGYWREVPIQFVDLLLEHGASEEKR